MPKTLAIAAPGRGFTDITARVSQTVEDAGIQNGAAHLFAPHTSASLLIQENADPNVQRDLMAYFDRLVPENAGYAHEAEGPDDMPAHIKTALTATSLTIPISEGRLMLGVWQGGFLFEHRRAPQNRRVVITFTREE